MNLSHGWTGSRDKHLKLWAVEKESKAVNTIPLRSRLEEVCFFTSKAMIPFLFLQDPCSLSKSWTAGFKHDFDGQEVAIVIHKVLQA